MFSNFDHLVGKIIILVAISSPINAFKLTESGSGTISYERFVRLNEPASGKRDAFDWLETSYEYDLKRGPIEGRFDGDLRFFINNNKSNISLSEAFFSYTGVTGSKHTLGRQKLDWHPNEQFWQLSHLNGMRNFRLMDQKQEGLIGYKLSTNHGPVKAEYFLSYFYVPTLNPSIELEDGKVVSNTDWYRTPPRQAIVRQNGVPTDIQYEINQPDIRDIFLQKSLGGRLSFDWSGQEPYTVKKTIIKKKKGRKVSVTKTSKMAPVFGRGEFSGFAIYKPEANIRINASTQYDTTSGVLPVRADPRVNHHLVFGGMLKQDIGMTKNIAGITYVDPTARLGQDFDAISLQLDEVNEVSRQGYLIDPKYDRETYLHFSTSLPGNILSVGINGIHYLTKHDRGNDDFYGDTVRWLSALGFNAAYNISDRLDAVLNLRYDFKRRDNLLDARITIKPFGNAFVNVGLELIRSPSTTSYWSPYRANDTGYVNFGMTL